MKSSRAEDRLIVIRHNGRVDCAEVLFCILKHCIEDPDRGCSATENSSGRQSG